MTDAPKMKSQVATIAFAKGDVSILCHYQVMPADEEGGSEKGRWLFNVQQFAQMNGLQTPEGSPTEVCVETTKERDALAERLLDAAQEAVSQMIEMQKQVSEALGAALPQPEVEEPPAAVEPPAPVEPPAAVEPPEEVAGA